MIINIIFDLGNVLLDQKDVTADVYLAKILKIPYEVSNVFYKQYRRAAVSGELSFIHLIRLFQHEFNSVLSVHDILGQYIKLYVEDVKGVNHGLIDLIGRLKKKYSIFLMTV
jgi:FMN phosphatase YigB (HAD superfamily)